MATNEIHRHINGVVNLLFLLGLLAITAAWMWMVSSMPWPSILLHVGLAFLAWSCLIAYVNKQTRDASPK